MCLMFAVCPNGAFFCVMHPGQSHCVSASEGAIHHRQDCEAMAVRTGEVLWFLGGETRQCRKCGFPRISARRASESRRRTKEQRQCSKDSTEKTRARARKGSAGSAGQRRQGNRQCKGKSGQYRARNVFLFFSVCLGGRNVLHTPRREDLPPKYSPVHPWAPVCRRVAKWHECNRGAEGHKCSKVAPVQPSSRET